MNCPHHGPDQLTTCAECCARIIVERDRLAALVEDMELHVNYLLKEAYRLGHPHAEQTVFAGCDCVCCDAARFLQGPGGE